MTTVREIPGRPGYFASNDGRIYTAKKKGGNDRAANRRGALREMSYRVDARGYLTVILHQRRAVTVGVHRLVLEAFVGPCPPGMEACHHPDPSPRNNTLANLRWDTHAENVKDKVRGRGAVTHKSCRRCRLLKPAAEFYSDRRASDGLKTECKPCHSLVSMATRDTDSTRRRNREWMRAHREKVRSTTM